MAIQGDEQLPHCRHVGDIQLDVLILPARKAEQHRSSIPLPRSPETHNIPGFSRNSSTSSSTSLLDPFHPELQDDLVSFPGTLNILAWSSASLADLTPNNDDLDDNPTLSSRVYGKNASFGTALSSHHQYPRLRTWKQMRVPEAIHVQLQPARTHASRREARDVRSVAKGLRSTG
jgi:hypothetical protein